MALERRTVIDLRQVLEDGQIQVREATYIVDTDTGERVSNPSYHRYVLAPGDDVSAHPEAIQRIANAEWTKEVVAAFNDAATLVKDNRAVLKSTRKH
jgi:hypothetical protein